MAFKKNISGDDFFKDELKAGLAGAYLFYGDEDYMKQYYLLEAEKKLVTSKDSMRFIRLSNDDFSPDILEEALSSAAMPDLFATAHDEDENDDGKRLIELYEIDFKSLKAQDFTRVCSLIHEKSDTESIVIVYSTPAELPTDSKPHQTLIRELSKVAKPVEFCVETDSKLCTWIARMTAKQNISISPDDCRYLLERVGRSMLLLKTEVEKLCMFLKAGAKVTRADIDLVTCANKEISPFDFSNALMRRDSKTAFYILEDMKMHGEEPIVILSAVTRVLNDLICVRGCLDEGLSRNEIAAETKMHEYKVKLYSESLKNIDISKLFAAAKAASDADLLLKSSPVDSYTIIERLICELTGIR